MIFDYGLNKGAFDRDLPNRTLEASCEMVGLLCFNLTSEFRSAGTALYLPRGDMHWNQAGHAIAARAVAPFVSGLLEAGTPAQ